jgi:hypothetical protein
MDPSFCWAPRDGRRRVAAMVTDEDGVVHRPFGGYTVEVETLPDGRTIRYYAWPPDAEEDDTPEPAERDEP